MEVGVDVCVVVGVENGALDAVAVMTGTSVEVGGTVQTGVAVGTGLPSALGSSGGTTGIG